MVRGRARHRQENQLHEYSDTATRRHDRPHHTQVGGGLCVGDGTKRGGDDKKNGREKSSSCHGPVGPESSWINIKDIKQTNRPHHHLYSTTFIGPYPLPVRSFSSSHASPLYLYNPYEQTNIVLNHSFFKMITIMHTMLMLSITYALGKPYEFAKDSIRLI